jgi:DNA-binding response OmpR family regulator
MGIRFRDRTRRSGGLGHSPIDNAPRLAILDWMMPGIDGIEICQRTRAAAREPYVYMVLLTARTEKSGLG